MWNNGAKKFFSSTRKNIMIGYSVLNVCVYVCRDEKHDVKEYLLMLLSSRRGVI